MDVLLHRVSHPIGHPAPWMSFFIGCPTLWGALPVDTQIHRVSCSMEFPAQGGRALHAALYPPCSPVPHVPLPHMSPPHMSHCPTGLPEPVEVRDNGDGTHKVTYTPATDGPYTVSVKYGGQEVPRR